MKYLFLMGALLGGVIGISESIQAMEESRGWKDYDVRELLGRRSFTSQLLQTMLFVNHVAVKEMMICVWSRYICPPYVKELKVGPLSLLNHDIGAALIEAFIFGGLSYCNEFKNYHHYADKNINPIDIIIGGVRDMFIAYIQEIVRQPLEWVVPKTVKQFIKNKVGEQGYYVLRITTRDGLRYILRSALYSLMATSQEKRTIIIQWAGFGIDWHGEIQRKKDKYWKIKPFVLETD